MTVGWHHHCNGHELGQTPGDGKGQGILACCSPRGCEELDMTRWLNNISTSDREEKQNIGTCFYLTRQSRSWKTIIRNSSRSSKVLKNQNLFPSFELCMIFVSYSLHLSFCDYFSSFNHRKHSEWLRHILDEWHLLLSQFKGERVNS